MMKFLCAKVGNAGADIVENLEQMGYQAELYEKKMEHIWIDEEEIEKLSTYITEKQITHLISINLIFNFALASANTGVKYLSIVWDAPYDILLSPIGRIGNCWYSTFDKKDAQRFQNAGIKHVMYHPLSVNTYAIPRWRSYDDREYYNDICFIGSLYDKNDYDAKLAGMPELLQDYFSSIFEEAAFRWDGIDRIHGKTDESIVEYLQKIMPKLTLHNSFGVKEYDVFENLYLIRKLGNIERIGVLNLLAEYFNVTCHTNADGDVSKLEGVRIGPRIAAGEATALVYEKSKINLNIGLKGIEGGTPLRVLDIMAAGGFVLSSYCEETAELFEENREIVMFKTPEELIEKAAYYLEHEEERKAIAQAGRRKVLSDYTYAKHLRELIDWAEGDCRHGKE